MIRKFTIASALKLLNVAKRDLNELVNANLVADESFGFHAQQAVEKALKAWFTALNLSFDFTHDIGDLILNLKKHDKKAEKFLDLVFLTPFSVEYRYEESGFDKPLDREQVIREIKSLVVQVEKILKAKR